MALTVTTDLTVITTAETTTGWSSIGTGSGSALEPDFWVQGTSATAGNCISRAVSGAVTKGMAFDYGSSIDFTTGTHQDKLVFIWIRVNTPQLIDTRAAGGLSVRLCTTSAIADYREWYVDGRDTIPAPAGWICYTIDPEQVGSVADTGTYNAASVRYFGATITTTTSAKGQNIGIDKISFGRGEMYVSGTVTTAGEGFKEIAAIAYDTATTNRWGTITVKSGVIYVKGRIVLGDSTGTASLTFSSYNEQVVFESASYKGVFLPALAYTISTATGRGGGTHYNGIAIVGNTTGTTSVTFGVAVGSDNGRAGSTISSYKNPEVGGGSRSQTGFTVGDNVATLNIYGTTFVGFQGISGIDTRGTGVAGDPCYGTSFIECNEIDSNMSFKNCNVTNANGGQALLWSSDTSVVDSLFAGNASSYTIKFSATTGTPFTFTNIIFAANTVDVRNDSGGAITINIVGGTIPSVSNGTGASTTISSPVPVTITVVDKTDTPIATAQTAVYVGATQVFNQDTNGSGVATGSYSGTVPAAAIYKIRKSSTGATKYISVSGPTTIESGTGASVKVVLYEDPNA